MKAEPPSLSTRQRLLDAAARVFARDGLSRATTREIAREAGVNEVTLFRHFQTKDGLISAVVGENFAESGAAPVGALPAPTDDLRADLENLARHYEALLKANLPLVRTMLGEVQHRHGGHEKQVFRAVFAPLKAALAERIRAARDQDELRPEFRADVLADLLGGMIFTGVLRRSSPDIKLEYTATAYRQAAIDLVLSGATMKREGRPR
ncbi:TetR/AcrR family transcriptional regulator [Horticoccus luteus]|uniref:TetR/AcrR family transcriptional regulator n=1 Tax=Horticoccus luteus TaxID=2862869 RepID=UPI0021062ED8|nr:TetR/AcrR family transcriptional regulator [Horticoccus luteus]